MAAPYGTGQVSAGVGKPIAAPNRREGQPSAGTGTPGASTAPLNSCKGQVSVELIIITAVMASLLLLMLMVNNSLQQSWGAQKQVLEATAAANQVAIAMNRAAAGGDGTTVSFMNTVSPDITSIQIFDKRTVRAYYSEGGYASAALVTNDTNVSGSVPINRQVIVSNNGNTINLISGPVAGPVGTACGGSGAAC